ncbi:MAG: sensor histidine kinase [Methylococcales bacterium]|nr:sensor histidine kinase [Methylococcales bacterium]
MNLKFHLLVRITLVAVVCLLTTATYVLYRADQQSKQQSHKMLESIGKQLEVQLLRIDTGFDRYDKFPDLGLWKETRSVSGVCIRFTSENNTFTEGICQGSEWPDKHWPKLFETLYRFIFNPGIELFRKVTFKNKVHGSISIIPSVEMELSRAWESLRALLELSAITISTICLLIYISINRALRPAQVIVSGLEKMQKGDLTVRLPHFELLEWQRTSTAINELAISQQQLLSDRKNLTFKLISIQDEERRYLARELHDELGQCLAAINALSVSITQTAKQECPVIVEDAESISRINSHIMNTVRTLLVKLRPAEIDELGLELSLKSLISEWNVRSNHKINYRLTINGDCQQLSEPHPIMLFRIIQECLTNIAKHSTATSATVELDISDKLIVLTIEDNGDIDLLSLTDTPGLGLLGIRERVCPLGGELMIKKSESGGLSITVTLPVNYDGYAT